MEYLLQNQEILRGWIQYHMILYLQRRNPSVPGISDKLYPPQERKLEKVKKYWKLLSELAPVHEIYGENRLAPENISIDHFVPWSYVPMMSFGICIPPPGPSTAARAIVCRSGSCIFRAFPEDGETLFKVAERE